jgi:hypothetical protein
LAAISCVALTVVLFRMQYVDIYTGCTTRVHAVDVSRVWNSGIAPLGWEKRAAGDPKKSGAAGGRKKSSFRDVLG